MDRDDLAEMNATLEQMLLCTDLDEQHHELIERCLDEGYFALGSDDKAMVRRLLNTRSSRSKRPGQGNGILQRYRERRQQALGQDSAGAPRQRGKRVNS